MAAQAHNPSYLRGMVGESRSSYHASLIGRPYKKNIWGEMVKAI
jgi:hypothetical protein